MLFPERPKNLPYLADYLQYAATKKPYVEPGTAADMAAGLALGGMAALAGFLIIGGPMAVVAAGIAGAAGFGGYFLGSRHAGKVAAKKPADADLVLEQEARAVVLRMSALMHRRRLHRDLSTEVMTLLEEASVQWSRARAALLSPYWTANTLSAHLNTVRESCLYASERAMQELLVLFATAVPSQPGSWNLAEVADEVFGKNVFSGPPNRRLSLFHDDAVRVVGRLKELADEAESVSRQLVSDPELGAQGRPGASLEATLLELKQLRQAEDELRENLSH